MYMTVKAMNKKIPEFNANIGKEFDDQSVILKKKNSFFSLIFILFLFLGAGFIDLGLRQQLPLILGLIFTTISIILFWRKDKNKTLEQWTYTRVAAESIKSEWFKFISGGGDYPCNKNVGEEYYENLFIKNLNEKITEYRKHIIKVNGSPIEYKVYIDEQTRLLRGKSFQERVEIYKKNRIEDQLSWYEKKAVAMGQKDSTFKFSFYLVAIIGLAFGAIKLLGIDILNINLIKNSDVYSIAIALAFTLDNLKKDFQYERLTINYKKSADDLSESLRKINDTENDIQKDENVFSEFVEDVENRISSEHKSWSLTTSSKNIADF